MSKVTIKLKAPYWSAWQKYGWTKYVPGFGLALKKLLEAKHKGCIVEVIYMKEVYTAPISTLIQYVARTNRSTKFSVEGTTLYVFPKSLFDRELEDL